MKGISRNGFYSQQQVIGFLIEAWKRTSPAEQMEAMEAVADRRVKRA